MDNIKVSFVIPIYNAGKYLVQCLSSLTRQTLKEIEMICIDDGSKDNCAEIIQDFAQRDNRFKIILQTNKGAGASRNIGLDTARGEYVHFLDADDWVCDDFAQKVYTTAKNNDLDLVCFNVSNYDNKTGIVTPNQFFPPSFWPLNAENKVLTWKNYKNPFLGNFSAANKLYKTQFLRENNIRFIEDIHFEDHPFHIESFLKSKKLGVINKSLYFYRKNIKESFMSTMTSDDRVFDIFKVFEELRKIITDLGLYEDLRKDYLDYIICLGINMFMNGVSWNKRIKFYNAHKILCKKIENNEDENMVVIHSKSFINFMDVLKYPWFVFFFKYKRLELKQKRLKKEKK